MITALVITSFFLGSVTGGCVARILDIRQEKKREALKRRRYDNISAFLTRLYDAVVSLTERFDLMRAENGAEPSDFEREFLRKCRVVYFNMAEEAKGRSIPE